MSDGLLKNTSLLDLAFKDTIDVWAVFMELDEKRLGKPRSGFWRLMKPGFRHVEVWKQLAPGAWLQLGTAVEYIKVELAPAPPWEILDERLDVKAIRVRRHIPMGPWRHAFFMGPITCVELTKAFLGIGSFFVRTPYQLYKYLGKESNE
jgi:hypothetical protein